MTPKIDARACNYIILRLQWVALQYPLRTEASKVMCAGHVVIPSLILR